MPLLHIVILALVQGATEVLPVSSSAHLLIVHALLGEDGQQENLIIDIALHVGTLVAVLFYFRRDLWTLVENMPRWLDKSRRSEGDKTGAKIVLNVIIASLPVIVAGLLIHIYDPSWSRSLAILPWGLIGFGILLWIADRFMPSDLELGAMTWKKALFIGMAQILSLVPGTSRSGVTMTAARFMGFRRVEAARFSLFLAIVAISGAGVLGGIGLLEENNAGLTSAALIGAAISCAASWVAIVVLMRWLATASFTPFVIYRILLGIALLAMMKMEIIAA